MNSLYRAVLREPSARFIVSRRALGSAAGHIGQVRMKFVKWRQDGNGVRRITMINPKMRNALSLETMKELTSATMCDQCDNEAMRCMLIEAEGPVFSAGHNLKELRTADGIDHHKEVFETCNTLMMSIRSAQVPVVAKVRGLAAAAGCQLAAICDIVVAGSGASFSTPGVNFGLFCSTPGVPLVRNVPLKLATYMLFTGRPIDAETALRAGLVSCVVPDEELDAKTEEVLEDIVAKSKPVLSLGRNFLLRQQENPTMHTALTDAAGVMVQNLRLTDAQEGIKSFIEKRKPKWSHRNYKAH